MQVFQEKGLAKNIPIIIMSAKSEDDIKQAVDNINADEFIQKPFKMEELIAKIEKVII
jgi:DNA-binding response OmpR family regulator